MAEIELPRSMEWDELQRWLIAHVTGPVEPLEAMTGTTEYALTTGVLAHILSGTLVNKNHSVRPVAGAVQTEQSTGDPGCMFNLSPEYVVALRMALCLVLVGVRASFERQPEAAKRQAKWQPKGDAKFLRIVAAAAHEAGDWLKACAQALAAAAAVQTRLDQARAEVDSLSRKL